MLTSRAQVFDTIGIVKPVELNEMSPAEARTFLFTRTGFKDNSGPEQSAAAELAKELGFLPLALEQAGAFTVENQSRFQDYLRSFRNRRLELLDKHGPVAGDYHESVRTTWSMNFRQLEKESEAAADLLRLSAFLSPDSIPLEFLAAGAPELGNLLSAALADVQEDPVVLDETLAPSMHFSLIHRFPRLPREPNGRHPKAIPTNRQRTPNTTTHVDITIQPRVHPCKRLGRSRSHRRRDLNDLILSG